MKKVTFSNKNNKKNPTSGYPVPKWEHAKVKYRSKQNKPKDISTKENSIFHKNNNISGKKTNKE